MENHQIIVSKKDGTQTNRRRLLVRRNPRKQNSYQQVIHIKLWITFLNFFKKSLEFSIFMCYNIEKLINT